MTSRVNLTLADRVYEFAVTHKTGDGQGNPYTIPVAKTDAACRGNPYHVGGMTSDWFKELRRDILKAEKIVLDDDFVRLAARQSVTHNTAISQLELSRNPFNTTWIEWDSRVMWDELVKKSDEVLYVGSMIPGETLLLRSGALLKSGSADGSNYDRQQFMLYTDNSVWPRSEHVYINTEGEVKINNHRRGADGVNLITNSVRNIFTYLLGIPSEQSWVLPPNPDDDSESYSIALDMNAMSYNTYFSKGIDALQMRASFDREIREATGIGSRFLFAAMALINEAEIRYHYKDRPGRRMSSGKTLPYMSHRTVTIEVPTGVKDVTRYYDKLFNTAIRHRAHHVRGFWRTLNKNTNDERKVWIKPHVRGDVSLGWVHQDHVVTTPV